MAKTANSTTLPAIDKAAVFKAAHKATRDEFANHPRLTKGLTYRELFAFALRTAYRNARSTNTRKVVELRSRRELIQMKTRLSEKDWADIHQIDRQIASVRVAA